MRAGPHGGHRAEHDEPAVGAGLAWRRRRPTHFRGQTRRCTCRPPALRRAPSQEPIARWRSPRSPSEGTARRARRGRACSRTTASSADPVSLPAVLLGAPRGRANRARPARATTRASHRRSSPAGPCGSHRRVRLQPSPGGGGQRDVLVGQRQAHDWHPPGITEQFLGQRSSHRVDPCPRNPRGWVDSVMVDVRPATGDGTAPPRSRG